MPTSVNVYNLNKLSPVGFEFAIARIPNVIWTITEVNVPGVSLGDSSRNYATGKVAIPGDTLEYDELSITFIVDESLNNWRELYNWMRGLAPTHLGEQDNSQYSTLKNSDFSLVSDGVLTLMTNTGNPNIIFKFKDIFPSNLGSLALLTTATGIDTISATASFRYTRFDIDVNTSLNVVSTPSNNV